MSERWRTGRSVGRTIYTHHSDDPNGQLIGLMDTPELAALVCAAVNTKLASPSASQAATGPSDPGCGSPAASDPGGGSAGHTALRDRIRGAFHSIAPDCVAYHPADCTDCTMRADAVMAEMRAELDAKDAENARVREQIAYYNRRWHQAMDDGDDKFLWVLQERSRAVSAERRSDRYRTAWESARRGRRSWRQRAEAAEAALATQNAENDRLDQLLIDERAITARLNRELAQLQHNISAAHQHLNEIATERDAAIERAEAAEAKLRNQQNGDQA